MHALIIEDHKLVAALVEDCLEEMGFDSFDFADCHNDAVAAALRKLPDLIIADDKLVEGTGFGAVTVIRETQNVRVVFASAEPERVLELDPYAITVTKPFSIDQFKAAVVSAMQSVSDTNR